MHSWGRKVSTSACLLCSICLTHFLCTARLICASLRIFPTLGTVIATNGASGVGANGRATRGRACVEARRERDARGAVGICPPRGAAEKTNVGGRGTKRSTRGAISILERPPPGRFFLVTQNLLFWCVISKHVGGDRLAASPPPHATATGTLPDANPRFPASFPSPSFAREGSSRSIASLSLHTMS